MQEELRRQETARRAFVSTASHELRTPLTMLQGTMELLEEDLTGGAVDLSDARQQVATARRELRRLSALAGELLDLSRLDAAVPLRSEPVELGEVARAVAAEFELRASERGGRARRRAARGAVLGPRRSRRGRPRGAHPARQRAPLRPAGRAGARARRRHRDGGRRVTVADRGRGVPPQEREHIFERFHRGSAAGSEGGFGLGLAIGRELAVRMGGDLRLADPTPGAGRVLRAHAPQRGLAGAAGAPAERDAAGATRA